MTENVACERSLHARTELTKLLIIDNCIAGGKSTLINNLKAKHPEWTFIQEGIPLDPEKEIIYLGMPEMNMVEFQNLIALNLYNSYNKLKRKIEKNKKINDNSPLTVVGDRIWSSPLHFGKYYNIPANTTTDYLFKHIYNFLKEENVFVYYVFLIGSVDDILNNIKARNRVCERHYKREDIKKLIELYQPFEDLQGLWHKIKLCQIGPEFYNNETDIIEEFLFS